MIDSGSDNSQRVVLVGEVKQGFALHVGIGNIDAVELRMVVVEYAEKIVVVAKQIYVGLRQWGARASRGRGHETEVGDGAEEAAAGMRRRGVRVAGWLTAAAAPRGNGQFGVDGAKERGSGGGDVLFLDKHWNVTISNSGVKLKTPSLACRRAGRSCCRQLIVATATGPCSRGRRRRRGFRQGLGAGPLLTCAGLEEARATGQGVAM